MIESRKMDITAEHKQEETSSAIGMAGTVAAVGNFERADAFAIIVANGLAEAQIKLGSNPAYSGSNDLQYIFKPDTLNNKPGASKLIAIQPGERKRATLTLQFNKQELILEAVSGGKWGNNVKISLTEGTNRDYKFTYDIDGVKKGYDNKSPAEIRDKINSSNSYLTAKLVDKEPSTFEEVLNEPLTGGEESSTLTINDYIEALDFIIKEDVDILIFTDILDDSFKPIVSEYLENKKTRNNRSIALDSIAPNETIDNKIIIADTARSSDAFYINQNIQVNDSELGESESVARMAGIIAGTPVTESLSKQTIGDIQKVDPVLTDKEIDDLTDKGIICLELINRENNEYGVYSAVSSCIDTNENGKKVPEAEFHATRSEIYVEKYIDKKIREIQGKTGKALSLLALNSILAQAVSDLLKDNIVIALTAEAFEDPEDSERFLIKYDGKVRGIVNRIHNIYTWTME